LLLVPACAISAGAVYVISPEIFTWAFAPAQNTPDLDETVQAVLAQYSAEPGTELPPGALETQVMAAVVLTVQASTPGAALGSGTSSPTPSPLEDTFVPLSTPLPAKTDPPGYTPPPPTRTPTPRGPTATPVGPTATDVPTQPGPPTDTQPPPPDTPVPPTAGPAPTNTPKLTNTENSPSCTTDNPNNPNYCTPTP
jgi:hypothetical protein